MRRSHGPYTIGLLSTPAPHNSCNPSLPQPTSFPATFTTTPMEHLDFTLSQISPGLGVENLQPPVSSPPPHKSTVTPAASSPVATPSSYPRYESVFKSRYSATTPLATLSVRPTPTTLPATTFSSSRIYTISNPTSLREPGSSPLSAFTSIGSTLKPPDANLLSTLSTFTASSPVASTTTFIQTTALAGKVPSPERPLNVTLDASQGYDNLRYESDSAQPKSNLEAWQAKQKGDYYECQQSLRIKNLL
ncbi:anti-sigma-I factor RsgI2-like [Hyalella azteca]|uniref:Anti-sigma-I factor RsgI2-like n=1 Tax=Hyalella azteca TaxID=294128 RepID=A0A8B7P803_HYAAZ|nr:anti-sigma-I factor RsgI2-like [Hyalella azteca]